MENVLTHPVGLVQRQPPVACAPLLAISDSNRSQTVPLQDWFDQWYPLLLPLSLTVNAFVTFSLLSRLT